MRSGRSTVNPMTPRTQARRLARPGRRTAAAAALVALGLGLGASPAAAVNPLTTAGELDVVEQTVVTSWVEGVDGAPGTQRMLVDVRAVGRVEAGGQTQVLIVTPTEPTVTPGTPDVLTAVADAASPEEIVQLRFTILVTRHADMADTFSCVITDEQAVSFDPTQRGGISAVLAASTSPLASGQTIHLPPRAV